MKVFTIAVIFGTISLMKLKKSTVKVLFLYEKAANTSDRKKKAAPIYVLKIKDFQHDC